MTDTNTRIWHVTISWRHRKQRYKQDVILCASDKETASNMAKNRIPMHLLEQDDATDTIQIRTRDLGLPGNNKTYFASKMQASAKEKDIIPMEQQIALTFAILWGHETGYRAGNPYVSVTETEQMDKLHNYPEKERKIYDLAQEYLSDNTKQPKEFFRNKISELLNDTITDIEQLTPSVILTDIDSAEQQAKHIIENAREQARELLDQYQTRVNNELNKALSLVDKLKNLKQVTIPTEIVKTEQESIDPELEETVLSTVEAEETKAPVPVKTDQNSEKPEQKPVTDTKQTQAIESDTDTTTDPKPAKIYNEELPFDNDETVQTEKPATEEEIKEALEHNDQNNNQKPVESVATDTKSDTQDVNINTEKPVSQKTKPNKKLSLNVDDLGSVTRIITMEDLKEDHVFINMLKILSVYTITNKSTQTTIPAIKLYEKMCADKNIDKKDKNNINVQMVLEILSITDRKNGMSGWDYVTSTIRKEFPGCDFNLPIPKHQTI